MRKTARPQRLTVETKDDGSAAIICGECGRPFLEIANGEVKFVSKHGSGVHENILPFEHMRVLMTLLYQQLHPPEIWR
jgi:hypothetical protein